ncbi:MAG: hypothetical protein MRY21_06840 [Simkaniaceae bacterium]|nr:hypothetical protein [Simkaniaceae bacterium]
MFVLLLIFPIFWGYLCYKMRQNNFEIRVREVEVCEAFMEIAQNIRESEDPKAVYIKAARKYPQTAWYFKRVLKETTC